MNMLWDRLRACCPAPLPMGQREFWLGSLGIGLGLWLTGWLSQQALGDMDPWFIAPMGASAVLLFLLPSWPTQRRRRAYAAVLVVVSVASLSRIPACFWVGSWHELALKGLPVTDEVSTGPIRGYQAPGPATLEAAAALQALTTKGGTGAGERAGAPKVGERLRQTV